VETAKFLDEYDKKQDLIDEKNRALLASVNAAVDQCAEKVNKLVGKGDTVELEDYIGGRSLGKGRR